MLGFFINWGEKSEKNYKNFFHSKSVFSRSIMFTNKHLIMILILLCVFFTSAIAVVGLRTSVNYYHHNFDYDYINKFPDVKISPIDDSWICGCLEQLTHRPVTFYSQPHFFHGFDNYGICSCACKSLRYDRYWDRSMAVPSV